MSLSIGDTSISEWNLSLTELNILLPCLCLIMPVIFDSISCQYIWCSVVYKMYIATIIVMLGQVLGQYRTYSDYTGERLDIYRTTGKYCHTRAPSWILSQAENLVSSILQDGAMEWHYSCHIPPTHPTNS